MKKKIINRYPHLNCGGYMLSDKHDITFGVFPSVDISVDFARSLGLTHFTIKKVHVKTTDYIDNEL